MLSTPSGIKSVQTGFYSASLSVGSGEDLSYANITISDVNPAKCFCWFEHQSNGSSQYTATARLTSSTNLRLANNTAIGILGRWYVVEFY